MQDFFFFPLSESGNMGSILFCHSNAGIMGLILP